MMNILLEEYKKHKKFVLFYVCLCVFLAFFCGPFLNNYMPVSVKASTTTLSGEETISSLATQILGNSVSEIAGGYSSVVAVSCEPFTALLFLGIVENINRLCGSPLHMTETPAGNPIVLIVIAVFFVASKLMKSNETTQVFGIITLGELEKYLGLVFILVLGVLNVTGIATGVVNAVVSAASPETALTAGTDAVVTGLTVAWSVFMAIVSLVVYVVIKTVMSGLDVIQVSLSFIPGSAFFFETLKSLFAIFMVTINVICPPLGVAFNIIVFIIGCILFRICYNATRYFHSVYFRPLFKRIKGFDPHILLVSPKLPKRIRKYCEAQEINKQLVIPVYPLKYVGEEKVKKYDRWWWVANTDQNLFLHKRAGKKRVRKINFENTYTQPVYIRKGLWYYEIFSYLPDEKNLAKKFPKKEFSVVFSLEYFYRIEDILKITGYEDYTIIRENEKFTKKQRREEKRARRKEAFIQKLETLRIGKQKDEQE